MSRGLGRTQRNILDVMWTKAERQRTPERDLWKVDDLALRSWPKPNARARADARARVKRSCRRLVADNLIMRVGVGWTLPPETEQEARDRRKRNPKMGTEREQEQRERKFKHQAQAREHHRSEIVERDAQRRRRQMRPTHPSGEGHRARPWSLSGAPSSPCPATVRFDERSSKPCRTHGCVRGQCRSHR